MPLEAPAPQGDMLSQMDVLNHTLIVAPTQFHDHIQTKNTKPGEKSPCIRVNVVDFGDPDNPVIYRGVLWFGVISSSLRRSLGSFVAGRMTQGTATRGNNPPWQLQDITNEADWMAFLTNWLDNTPEGEAFQLEAIEEINRVAATTPTEVAVPETVATVAAPAPAAVPAPAPAVAAPAAAPAPRPATAAAPPPAAAPAPVAQAPMAVPQPDLANQLAGLPADELQKVLAALAAQNQAAH